MKVLKRKLLLSHYLRDVVVLWLSVWIGQHLHSGNGLGSQLIRPLAADHLRLQGLAMSVFPPKRRGAQPEGGREERRVRLLNRAPRRVLYSRKTCTL